MTALGIDIGTGSVRTFCPSATRVADISPVHDKQNPHVITQSSAEILDAIVKTAFTDIDASINAVSIAATCSMVVQERVIVDGTTYLRPFSVNGGDSAQDIILWMDNRAVKQTSRLNDLLADSPILSRLGGKVIPEMGVPKLLWLSDNFPEANLVVFEMYDWFSMVLLHGTKNGMVKYNEVQNNSLYDTSASSESMDGSIKGWDATTVYEYFGVSSNIHIGTLKTVPGTLLPPIGTHIGNVSSQFTDRTISVGHGCIDCYGGWISTLVAPQQLLVGDEAAAGTLSMIAGTSTCYLLSMSQNLSIPGIWGPFHQLLGPEFKPIFEFGQPATGKLFESLYGQYRLVLAMDDLGSFFRLMEDETAKLERQYGTDISIVLKDYFYYGDKYGNRSPFNEFTMNEVLMNGSNSETVCLPNLLESADSPTAVCMKYNLIIEFLVLQMKQIVDLIEANAAPIRHIVISGSQANNSRLVGLIRLMNPGKSVRTVADGQGKYSVARGAAIIGAMATTTVSSADVVDTVSSYNHSLAVSDTKYEPVTDPVPILGVKYWMLQKVSHLQSEYRRRVRTVGSGPAWA